MASMAMRRRRTSSVLILKEGFIFKRGEIIRTWVRRYCVINPQCLCYFKNEKHGDDVEPLGRVFLDDIIDIECDPVVKKKSFCFVIHTDTGHKRKSIYLQASSGQDRSEWIDEIKNAKEKEKRAERDDPFRRTLKKLTKGLKRVKLEKDEQKGIGCTIKNAAGLILVSRIIEDGPIAATGVLKPGDEILDIHGTPVTGKTVREIVQIIKECPEEFLATVKPTVSVRRLADPRMIDGLDQKTTYSELLFPEQNLDDEDIKEVLDCVNDPSVGSPSPPPVPPHTKESLVLLESMKDIKLEDSPEVSENGVDDHQDDIDPTNSMKQRRPHYYDEIQLSPNSGKVKLVDSEPKKPAKPANLSYAFLDFRQ